jgi:hypothetical protein
VGEHTNSSKDRDRDRDSTDGRECSASTDRHTIHTKSLNMRLQRMKMNRLHKGEKEHADSRWADAKGQSRNSKAGTGSQTKVSRRWPEVDSSPN